MVVTDPDLHRVNLVVVSNLMGEFLFPRPHKTNVSLVHTSKFVPFATDVGYGGLSELRNEYTGFFSVPEDYTLTELRYSLAWAEEGNTAYLGFPDPFKVSTVPRNSIDDYCTDVIIPLLVVPNLDQVVVPVLTVEFTLEFEKLRCFESQDGVSRSYFEMPGGVYILHDRVATIQCAKADVAEGRCRFTMPKHYLNLFHEPVVQRQTSVDLQPLRNGLLLEFEGEEPWFALIPPYPNNTYFLIQDSSKAAGWSNVVNQWMSSEDSFSMGLIPPFVRVPTATKFFGLPSPRARGAKKKTGVLSRRTCRQV
eukprot:GHVQ01032870.1.p1 GENE.GHVQ01032870.1~~GHVQ01032870.1.p1  ORF type:complete len:308 (-),score=22.34 GHVQ01032870.1:380-1303(-)